MLAKWNKLINKQFQSWFAALPVAGNFLAMCPTFTEDITSYLTNRTPEINRIKRFITVVSFLALESARMKHKSILWFKVWIQI